MKDENAATRRLGSPAHLVLLTRQRLHLQTSLNLDRASSEPDDSYRMKRAIRRVGFSTYSGENTSGLLVDDGGGNMSAHVLRNDLPFFAAKNPLAAQSAELRAAFEGYDSYFGTYKLTRRGKW